MSGAVPPPSRTVPLALVAAVARNGIIGADNALPWSLPGDLRHFRALTMGKPVLMGRRTFESIGRPLPGRFPVVLSGGSAAVPGVTTAGTVDEALHAAQALAREHGASEIMVAGGGLVYAALIGRAQRLYVTDVDSAPEGDTRFPAIDPAVWCEIDRSPARQEPRDSVAYTFLTYGRR